MLSPPSVTEKTEYVSWSIIRTRRIKSAEGNIHPKSLKCTTFEGQPVEPPMVAETIKYRHEGGEFNIREIEKGCRMKQANREFVRYFANGLL